MARPTRSWSIEKGLCFVVSIGRLCFSAYSMAASRVRARSRTGEMESMSGAIEVMETLKRTWSLPCQPWATTTAPIRGGGLDQVLSDDGTTAQAGPGAASYKTHLAFRRAGMQYSLAKFVASRRRKPQVSTVERALADKPRGLSRLADVDGDGVAGGLLYDPSDGDRGVQAALNMTRTTRSLLDMWFASNGVS